MLIKIYLDSSNLSDDDNFNLPGYNMVRVDHPSYATIHHVQKQLVFPEVFF